MLLSVVSPGVGCLSGLVREVARPIESAGTLGSLTVRAGEAAFTGGPCPRAGTNWPCWGCGSVPRHARGPQPARLTERGFAEGRGKCGGRRRRDCGRGLSGCGGGPEMRPAVVRVVRGGGRQGGTRDGTNAGMDDPGRRRHLGPERSIAIHVDEHAVPPKACWMYAVPDLAARAWTRKYGCPVCLSSDAWVCVRARVYRRLVLIPAACQGGLARRFWHGRGPKRYSAVRTCPLGAHMCSCRRTTCACVAHSRHG